MVKHFKIMISPKPRGAHLITSSVLRELGEMPNEGILSVFLQHTSAGITINENTAKSVLSDFETALNRIVPQGDGLYTHTDEGSDDMPAHIKSSLIGQSIMIPISGGKLLLGTWQGIYLCEFRDIGGPRSLVASLYS